MVHRSLLRLFIAVELPSVFQSRIRPLQASLTATKVRLRLVAPENIHFTLKFLGETPATQVPQITTVLNEIKAPPIPSPSPAPMPPGVVETSDESSDIERMIMRRAQMF